MSEIKLATIESNQNVLDALDEMRARAAEDKWLDVVIVGILPGYTTTVKWTLNLSHVERLGCLRMAEHVTLCHGDEPL